MFNRPKPKTRTQLEIDKLVLALSDHAPTSDEYGKILDRLKELSKVQKETLPESVSPDMKLQAAVNLTGILLIIQHEHAHVIASKALTFVQKLR